MTSIGRAVAAPFAKLAAVLVGFAALLGAATAGTDLVAYPAGLASRFVRYNETDRPDRKIVRVFYANPESWRDAKAGQPAPYGTVLVMEDRKARLKADGSPETDAEGRMVPTDEVTAVFLMEKRRGWGADYPPEKRNGEWEYAWFNPDGSRRAEARFDGCFACHKSRTGRDFTFTFAKTVLDRK